MNNSRFYSTTLGVGLVLLVFGGLLAAEIYGESHGGYSIDPTDPSNFYQLVIHNDLKDRVMIRFVNNCLNRNPGCDEQWILSADQATSHRALRDTLSQYKVIKDNKTLGCLLVTRTQSQTRGEIKLETSHFARCTN